MLFRYLIVKYESVWLTFVSCTGILSVHLSISSHSQTDWQPRGHGPGYMGYRSTLWRQWRSRPAAWGFRELEALLASLQTGVGREGSLLASWSDLSDWTNGNSWSTKITPCALGVITEPITINLTFSLFT